jgi:hypothetical protein
VQWLQPLDLTRDHFEAVLTRLCDDGASNVKDLVFMEQEDVDKLIALVPKLKQKVSRG